jgi:hypothetical protein
VVRALSAEEIERINSTADHYVTKFKRYRTGLKAES